VRDSSRPSLGRRSRATPSSASSIAWGSNRRGPIHTRRYGLTRSARDPPYRCAFHPTGTVETPDTAGATGRTGATSNSTRAHFSCGGSCRRLQVASGRPLERRRIPFLRRFRVARQFLLPRSPCARPSPPWPPGSGQQNCLHTGTPAVRHGPAVNPTHPMGIPAVKPSTILERDAFWLNRHRALSCLSMIFSENRCPLFRIML
jgi:hypothetical protein